MSFSINIHYLQHVSFEDPGYILNWFADKSISVTSTRLYDGSFFPNVEELDGLIIMGGPMGINDEGKYHWLVTEKRFVESAIKHRKVVIGICLGAQIIADVLGAKVYPHLHREIGWFPIKLTDAGRKHKLFEDFPDFCDAFHWHGDTFDIPADAVHIAESEGCKNQAFVYANHVIGLQFHLEIIPEGINRLLRYCASDIVKSPYIQSPTEMTTNTEKCDQANTLISSLLDRLFYQNS